MLGYSYICKGLLRNGVSKKLLWTKYMNDCHANDEESLMYSQFCYHIQQDEHKWRATTMHIIHKPTEQVEIDWTGNLATTIDPDTGEIVKTYLCWCDALQPVCVYGSMPGYEAEIMD